MIALPCFLGLSRNIQHHGTKNAGWNHFINCPCLRLMSNPSWTLPMLLSAKAKKSSHVVQVSSPSGSRNDLRLDPTHFSPTQWPHSMGWDQTTPAVQKKKTGAAGVRLSDFMTRVSLLLGSDSKWSGLHPGCTRSNVAAQPLLIGGEITKIR